LALVEGSSDVRVIKILKIGHCEVEFNNFSNFRKTAQQIKIYPKFIMPIFKNKTFTFI
jgi:hypothetical protein